MLEKTVETYLVDRVRAAGGDAYKFTSPARVSVPDRIVVFPPARIYFVELKRPGGKLTKGQVREHARLRALGCDVRTLDSREAVDAFVREASAPPAPYLHVYEYPSPFSGTHREFSPTAWNGQQPARTVALYAVPQLVAAPVEKRSTIDAIIALENAKMSIAMEAKPITHESLISESVVKDSASKVSQAVPIRPEPRTADEAVYRFGDDGVCRVQSAPADERAAFAEWCERFPEISRVERLRDAWNTARASSANETGAEAVGIVHRPAHNGQDFSVEWLKAPPAGKLYAVPQPVQADAREGLTEPLVLTSAKFSTDAVREAVEQGLWAADVKLTDDAWRNIEALLIEQARVEALKTARSGGAA